MLNDQDKTLLYGAAPSRSPGTTSIRGDPAEQLPLHPYVVAPFCALKDKALLAGINLQIASGFRGFERQLLIWNRKASGELPILGSDGQRLDSNQLSEEEKVFAILRWSALPGASRHHWGTDMDVFDANAIPDGYQLQLTADEARNRFGKLHCWLDEQIAQNGAMGFFRPFNEDRGGIAPELWHLSYAPLAQEFQKAFSIDELAKILQQTDMALKETVLANLQEIYERFIDVPYSVPPYQ